MTYPDGSSSSTQDDSHDMTDAVYRAMREAVGPDYPRLVQTPESPPPARSIFSWDPPIAAVPLTAMSPTLSPQRRGARMSVPPIQAPEEYFPPAMDQATLEWAQRLQAQGFAPAPPEQPYELGRVTGAAVYDPDQEYDPFRGWQQELQEEHDEPEQAPPPQDAGLLPAEDAGYDEEDDDDEDEEDPEEDPEEDDFWVAHPHPEDVEAEADIDPFPGAPDAPFHPFPGPPAHLQQLPDFPAATDPGEIVDAGPDEALTYDQIRAQRDELIVQREVDWERLHELEGSLEYARMQRDFASQQLAEERARAGRAQQVAAISGQAIRRLTERREEDVSLASRELELTDEEFQAYVQQLVYARVERRRRAQQKAPVRHDWGEGTSRQGGQS